MSKTTSRIVSLWGLKNRQGGKQEERHDRKKRDQQGRAGKEREGKEREHEGKGKGKGKEKGKEKERKGKKRKVQNKFIDCPIDYQSPIAQIAQKL